jgi:dihydroorotate dehydrogenase (NAD+) catalytic subunit
MIAGSSAIQLGTVNFIDPSAATSIIKGLEDFCIKQRIEKISEVTASYII